MDKKKVDQIYENVINIYKILQDIPEDKRLELTDRAANVVGDYPIYGAVSNLSSEELILMAMLVNDAYWWESNSDKID